MINTKYYKDLEQGSEEWFKIRCGKFTASEIKQLLTPKYKLADSEKVRRLVYEIAAQRINNYVETSYLSDDMMRGKLDEPIARELYSDNISPVEECGFITSEVFGQTIGYSPDGLVGDDGLIEIKSRIQYKQFKTITEDEVPEENMVQLQVGLMVTGRQWIDYISYSNGMPLYIKRVYPDHTIQSAILEALADAEYKIKRLTEQYMLRSQGLLLTERYIDAVYMEEGEE